MQFTYIQIAKVLTRVKYNIAETFVNLIFYQINLPHCGISVQKPANTQTVHIKTRAPAGVSIIYYIIFIITV